jgi:hypothetical protein
MYLTLKRRKGGRGKGEGGRGIRDFHNYRCTQFFQD